MKFYVHRDPSNKLQKIPYAAMQIAGLADREDLTLQADKGCILLSHDHLSTRETIQTATLLKQVTIDLMRQLVEASQEMASHRENIACKEAIEEAASASVCPAVQGGRAGIPPADRRPCWADFCKFPRD